MGKHLAKKNEKENIKKTFSFEIKKREKAAQDEEALPGKSFNFKRKKQGYSFALPCIAVLLLLLILFCPFEGWVLKAAYGVALIAALAEVFLTALEKISDKNYFAIEYAVILAAIVSFIIGLELEAVLISAMFHASAMLNDRIGSLSREELADFAKILPEYASVETAEGIIRVIPEYVNVGDILVVEAGESIPVDGVIVEGISTLDTSAVSGQTSPWAVAEGHRVYSGCRNLTSSIKIKAIKPAAQSTARSLVTLSKSSVSYLSRQEKFTENVKRFYMPAVLAAAVILAIVLSLINGQWIANISRAVVLLIASYSGIALSSVSYCYASSAGAAAEKGIFSKGSDCIEAMAKTETVVFDKTGVITEGRYIISDVFPKNVSEHELLTMAATAERFSRHPIAAALRDAVGKIDIDYKSLQIEEIPGRGVSAFVGERQVYVGNTALLEEHGIKCVVPTRSGAAIHVAVDYKYWGHILVTDRIRRGAFDSLENLRACGIKKMVLLTVDVLSVARPLASKLNFDMLRAELKPSEKLSAVDFLMSNRGEASSLAFVGDGNSDEQVMSRVDVGIAMGALGSDSAFSSADVLIMDRDIKKLPAAIKLSKLCYMVSLENILAWIVINLLLVVLGAMGLIPVIAAVIIQFVLICASMINTLRIK